MMCSYLESGRGDTLAQQQGPFCSQGSIQVEQAPKIQASRSYRRAKGRQEAGISVSGTSEVIRASSGRQMKALLGGSRAIGVCGVWRLLQSPQARLQCWSRHQQVSPSSMCPWVAFKVLQVQKTAIGNGVHVTSDLKNK